MAVLLWLSSWLKLRLGEFAHCKRVLASLLDSDTWHFLSRESLRWLARQHDSGQFGLCGWSSLWFTLPSGQGAHCSFEIQAAPFGDTSCPCAHQQEPPSFNTRQVGKCEKGTVAQVLRDCRDPSPSVALFWVRLQIVIHSFPALSLARGGSLLFVMKDGSSSKAGGWWSEGRSCLQWGPQLPQNWWCLCHAKWKGAPFAKLSYNCAIAILCGHWSEGSARTERDGSVFEFQRKVFRLTAACVILPLQKK